jgi:hypothetical protein
MMPMAKVNSARGGIFTRNLISDGVGAIRQALESPPKATGDSNPRATPVAKVMKGTPRREEGGSAGGLLKQAVRLARTSNGPTRPQMSNMKSQLDRLALLLLFAFLAGAKEGKPTGLPWIDDVPISQISLVNRKYRTISGSPPVRSAKGYPLEPSQQGAGKHQAAASTGAVAATHASLQALLHVCGAKIKQIETAHLAPGQDEPFGPAEALVANQSLAFEYHTHRAQS